MKEKKSYSVMDSPFKKWTVSNQKKRRDKIIKFSRATIKIITTTNKQTDKHYNLISNRVLENNLILTRLNLILFCKFRKNCKYCILTSIYLIIFAHF